MNRNSHWGFLAFALGGVLGMAPGGDSAALGLHPGIDDPIAAAYDEGYLDGYAIGFDDGFDDGFAEGKLEGLAEGFESGFQAGTATCFENPSSCDITFANLVDLADLGETEPNDNSTTADPLPFEETISGQSQARSDQDWYVISTITNNTALSVTLKVEGSTTVAPWEISVRDRSGNEVARQTVIDIARPVATSGDPDTPTDLEASFDTVVDDAGTYYIVVQPNQESLGEYSSYPYLLTVIATETDQTSPVNPGISFFDVETEYNGLWSSADLLASGVVMAGQLHSASDEDWYVITSNGDEILSVDFCNSFEAAQHTLFGEGCNSSWEVWVIDGDVDKSVLEDGIDGNPSIGQAPINAIEFLADRGALGGSVLTHITATLESNVGQEATFDIGITDPGTYYLVVAPVWEREDGALKRNVAIEEEVETTVIVPERCPSNATNFNGVCVVQPLNCSSPEYNSSTGMCTKPGEDPNDYAICPIGTTKVEVQAGDPGVEEDLTAVPPVVGVPATDEISYCETEIIPAVVEETVVQPEVLGGLTSDPFSTEQYTFSLRRSGLSPSTADSLEYALQEIRASYDPETLILHIPELQIGDYIYEADLNYAPLGNQMNFHLENIQWVR